jgi:hypothetical protein
MKGENGGFLGINNQLSLQSKNSFGIVKISEFEFIQMAFLVFSGFAGYPRNR